ncbi:MAG: hypothetical protein PVJ19_03470 [Desulfobacteraceae bacterium]
MIGATDFPKEQGWKKDIVDQAIRGGQESVVGHFTMLENNTQDNDGKHRKEVIDNQQGLNPVALKVGDGRLHLLIGLISNEKARPWQLKTYIDMLKLLLAWSVLKRSLTSRLTFYRIWIKRSLAFIY